MELVEELFAEEALGEALADPPANFLTACCFFTEVAGEADLEEPRLRVLEDGEPLVLLVVLASRPGRFIGLLVPALPRCMRPLPDILGVGVLTQWINWDSNHLAAKDKIIMS